MIMPSDKDYQQVKRVKKEGKPLPSPFRELAAWILSTYQTSVLDILHDLVPPGNRNRLQIVFEFDHEKRKFCEPNSINFDAAKQAAIRDCFLALMPHSDNARLQKDGLFVVFSAFEGVARIEANEHVTKREIERLQKGLGNENLWLIKRAFDGVFFFFHTDAQIQEAEANGLREIYTKSTLASLSHTTNLVISGNVAFPSVLIRNKISTPTSNPIGFTISGSWN
jgi:hypothetical protein